MTSDTAPKRKFNPLILLLPLGVVAIGAGIWYSQNQPKPGVLTVSGRLEGYETDIGAKVPGRVDVITVREGDTVEVGKVLVRLDDAQIQAQFQGAQARLVAAQEKASQAQLQRSILKSQRDEAQYVLQQAQGDSQGRMLQADANVASAQANLAQAQAQLVQSQSDQALAQLTNDRYQTLVTQGAINQQQFDQAQSALKSTKATVQARQAQVIAAQKQITSAQGLLKQAKTSTLNPAIRSKQLDVLANQEIQALSQRQAALADQQNALAAQNDLKAQLGYLTIKSPIAGVVTIRSVEPGAVVTQGKTLLTLLNLNNVYLRGYIPEGQIGKVRVGQKARVFLDSAPDQPLPAKVITIDAKASFTPENIYFRDDRVKQVFGIKIQLDNPQGFAKPGMPADAEILTEDVK